MGKKHPNFKIPERLLEQVNECSGGGFILFVFDQDGYPEVHASLDDPKSALSMQAFIINWAKALDEVTINNMIETFRKPSQKNENKPDDPEELE